MRASLATNLSFDGRERNRMIPTQLRTCWRIYAAHDGDLYPDQNARMRFCTARHKSAERAAATSGIPATPVGYVPFITI